MTAQLCAHLLKLRVILWELASEWLEEVEEVVRLNAAGTQQLQGAPLVAHDELALESGALAHNLIACQHCVDALAGLSSRKQASLSWL